MNLMDVLVIGVGCLVAPDPFMPCLAQAEEAVTKPAIQDMRPYRSGDSIDVILSADAVYVWDIATGVPLYEKEPDTERPVASLSKLLSALTIRELLPPDQIVEVPEDVLPVQHGGADIKLIPGEHATVHDLLEAGMVASANDAIVALAVASKGGEEEFVAYANEYGKQLGLQHTLLANATGLSGGQQHSTAREVAFLLERAYADSLLSEFLSQGRGVLETAEGTRKSYITTNDLLGTYVPIEAAKTGYTVEAGQSLAIITRGNKGQKIGAVLLGSEDRFQDMKVLVEWIWRNYTWP